MQHALEAKKPGEGDCRTTAGASAPGCSNGLLQWDSGSSTTSKRWRPKILAKASAADSGTALALPRPRVPAAAQLRTGALGIRTLTRRVCPNGAPQAHSELCGGYSRRASFADFSCTSKTSQSPAGANSGPRNHAPHRNPKPAPHQAEQLNAATTPPQRAKQQQMQV